MHKVAEKRFHVNEVVVFAVKQWNLPFSMHGLVYRAVISLWMSFSLQKNSY